MSERRYVAIRCDWCGRRSDLESARQSNPDATRANLARVGWTRDGRRDACPSCAKIIERYAEFLAKGALP